MAKIPNKFVLFGAVAAAALVIPGTLGPLAFQEARAEQRVDFEQKDNVVAVGVAANVDVHDVNVCLQALANEPKCEQE